MTIDILVVDDEDYLARTIQRALELDISARVDIALNVPDAQRLAEEKKYNLVILDGLGGRCFELYDALQGKVNGDIIILSGDDKIIKRANERNIPSYHKCDLFQPIIDKYKDWVPPEEKPASG